MLNTLIIISFLSYIAGFLVNGFTLYNVLLIIPTILFSIRKVGIHIKMSSIITTEVLFLVFSVLWRLMFNDFSIVGLILTVVIRIIFVCVVLYDDTVYVYVSEEKKKV